MSPARNIRTLTALGALLAALAISACGGSQPKVGDCVDSQRQVVGCSSPNATLKLVSNQSGPNAIACVQIGNAPQLSVRIGGSTFCAESVSASR